MAEIGIKELKATASAVIEDVERGASYVVTKRGRPTAVLRPIDAASDDSPGSAMRMIEPTRSLLSIQRKRRRPARWAIISLDLLLEDRRRR